MKTTIEFLVYNASSASPTGAAAYVLDRNIYTSIWRIATKPLGWDIKDQTNSCLVKAAPGDPQLAEILVLLNEAGWKPFYGEFVPLDLVDSRFWARRIRRYEKKDFDEAEYLTIHRWGGWDDVFQFDGIDNELFRGKVAGAKLNKRYGTTGTPRSPSFVNDELKCDLESAGLVGLTFLPVLWDRPEKAKGHFWQLSSSITMPRCLLPILDIPNSVPFRDYDDGGHFPQELVFRRSQVEAIEPFDVALTAPEEQIHRGPNSWPRTLVVSQRFRQVIKKLKLTTAELIPARLVADDWQRPLSDHDRLRSECV